MTNIIPEGCKSSGDLTTAYARCACCLTPSHPLVSYLRRHDVHRAIHASGPLGFVADWAICSSKIIYAPSGANMVDLYRKFQSQKPGFKILIYSCVLFVVCRWLILLFFLQR